MIEAARDWDVLVLGGGNAALCAAITARQAGASVLVVEAAPHFYRGGNTRHTRNFRLAHADSNALLTAPYPQGEFWTDLLRVTEGRTDEALARFTIGQSPLLWDFFRAQGVRFQPALGGTLSLSRTNAFFLGGGRAMLNALYAAADRLGVKIVYDAEAVGLEIAQGSFRAATVRKNGAAHRVAAKTLVAAAGGFEANIDWLKDYWGEAARNFHIRGTPYNRGGVLRLLLDHGVSPVGDPTQCHAVAVDSRGPQFDGGIVTRLDCIPFGIVVDSNGRRFYDEGEDFWPKRYAIWGRLVAEQPGQQAFVIFDSRSIRRFMPSLFPPLAGDSIAALAGKLGLDGASLEKTVADFNAAVRPGAFDPTILDDCRTEGLAPAKSHWATRIEAPPYYAYPLSPGITFTYLGVKVDQQARMQTAQGPTRNLFAAGEIMAGNVLGKGYVAGIGMTIGGVWGRVAGQEAARHALG
jgi:tricarballylate dehydrogenase